MDRKIMVFANAAEFETWLDANHASSGGIWLQIAKKDSGRQTVNYAQALDCALCYGWIDGQKAAFDELYFLQYFCKRKPTSVWSVINKGHIERLSQAGRMRQAGLAAVEAAKANGEWERAYQPVSSREIPPELQAALDQSPQAKAFFETLNSQNRYAFCFRVLTAKKPETKAKRVSDFIAMLEQGQVFYPKA